MTTAESRNARTGLGRILKNSASSQFLQAAEVLVFLGLTPFIVKKLGVEQYGVWGIIWATVGLYGLVDLGFGRAIVKFVADARGRGDTDLLQRTVSTLFWVFAAQAALLIPISLGVLAYFDVLFNAPDHYESQAKVAFIVVSAGAIFGLPLAMFKGVLVAYQDAWVGNLYHLVGLIVYAGCVLFFLSDSPSILTLSYLNLLRTAITPLTVTLFSLIRLPGTTIAPRHFDKKLLAECWRYSTALLVIQVTSLVGAHLDVFIIQAILPVTAVAWYVVAGRVATQAKIFCSQVEAVIEPIVAELHGAGDTDRLTTLWLNGARFSIAFATPLVVGCLVLCRPLLLSWVGLEFEQAVLPLQILLLAVWAAVIHGNSHIQLSMRGDQRFLAAAMVVGQALNVVASISLIHQFGLPGVAAATLIVPLAADVLIQRRVCRRLGISVLSSYAKSLGPSLLPAVLMVAVQVALLVKFSLDSLLEVAVVETVGAALFWCLFWVLGMSRDEKDGLLLRVRGRLASS